MIPTMKTFYFYFLLSIFVSMVTPTWLAQGNFYIALQKWLYNIISIESNIVKFQLLYCSNIDKNVLKFQAHNLRIR